MSMASRQISTPNFCTIFESLYAGTRSALSQIKSVFPEDATDRFKREFAALGKLSNPLRDLDVYLLNERRCKALLPNMLEADIEPLFDHLRANDRRH